MTRLNSVVSIECETNTHTLTRKASGAHHFVIAFVVTFQMMRNGLQRRKKINQANTFLVYFMPMSKIVTMIHMQTTFYNVQASISFHFFQPFDCSPTHRPMTPWWCRAKGNEREHIFFVSLSLVRNFSLKFNSFLYASREQSK